MSVQGLILSLLSNVTDPVARIDVATTVNYLFSVYSSGAADDRQVRNALFDVCYDVLRASCPDLTEDQVRDKANALVEQFIRAFRLEGARRRVLSSVGPGSGLRL